METFLDICILCTRILPYLYLRVVKKAITSDEHHKMCKEMDDTDLDGAAKAAKAAKGARNPNPGSDSIANEG